MTQRRWASIAIAGTLGLAAAGIGYAISGRIGARPAAEAGAEGDGRAKVGAAAALAGKVAEGDVQALTAVCRTITAAGDAYNKTPIGADEEADAVALLRALRVGFSKYSAAGRASAVAVAGHMLARYAVEPTPSNWLDTLVPTHDLFVAGLADPNVDVRSSSLNEVSRQWNWLPGRSMTRAEEATVASWKDEFVKPVTRCLGDREPKSRAAAVVCLGAVSIDSIAAPAAAYVEDPDSGGVRYKALMTFSNRPALLSEDTILKRLHDKESGIPELAELILKGRGLTKDQIYLGRQMDDPRPEVRAAVIPVLRDRTDVDPTVWLVRLSKDADETVRAKAAEALATSSSVEADQRLRELAAADTSAGVRGAAEKALGALARQTAANLPPLPGGPTATSLNLKAN